MGLDQFQQAPMVDVIEVGMDVGIDHVDQACIPVGLHQRHGLGHRAARAVAVAVGREQLIQVRADETGDPRLQHPFSHRRNGQHALSAPCLGDRNQLQRLRSVAAGDDLLAQALHFVGQVAAEGVKGLVVGACSSTVGQDAGEFGPGH